ncbi:thiamine-phosphate kinase [Isoalcanivorax indicus]|uniref:thiamine-phosphate kinase n=1 Tax=Isoalcanivorax indicus TaxID=2202653 RepID=UPI000DBA7515|nr:thiamine-phosphate kinase [Isoalcanivorax indicus]
MDEFALINRFFRTAANAAGPGVRLGPGDDAALLTPTPGCDLVMSMDTLVADRHFPADMPAADVGWRSLAVNLSDLAAMGARARWALLSLSLPEADADWVGGFARGFASLAASVGCTLVGGDTVRGPLSITVQVTGEVPTGQALLRSGARAGQRLCVGGVPGEAAAGLAAWQRGERDGPLVARLARPRPQLALGEQLRGVASACIDISDGLLADLGHLLAESAVPGADVHLPALPLSTALAAAGDDASRQAWQLAGGDDYLLLFALPAEQVLPADCHVIGAFSAEPGVRVLDASGQPVPVARHGWNHF